MGGGCFLFIGIRVVIIDNTCIRFLGAFVVYLAHFGISIFFFLVTGVDNIAAPELLVQSLIFVFEKSELVKNQYKSASNQNGKQDIWKDPSSIISPLK